jgi:hypothetical protein
MSCSGDSNPPMRPKACSASTKRRRPTASPEAPNEVDVRISILERRADIGIRRALGGHTAPRAVPHRVRAVGSGGSTWRRNHRRSEPLCRAQWTPPLPAHTPLRSEARYSVRLADKDEAGARRNPIDRSGIRRLIVRSVLILVVGGFTILVRRRRPMPELRPVSTASGTVQPAAHGSSASTTGVRLSERHLAGVDVNARSPEKPGTLARQRRRTAPRALLAATLVGLAVSVAGWRAVSKPPPAYLPPPGALLLVTSDPTVSAELGFVIYEPFSSEPMMAIGMDLNFPVDVERVRWAIAIDEALTASRPRCPSDWLNVEIVDSLICGDLVARRDIVTVGHTTVSESLGDIRAMVVVGSTDCCESVLERDRTAHIVMFAPLRRAVANRSGVYTAISGPRITRRVPALRSGPIDPATGESTDVVGSEPLIGTMLTHPDFVYRGSVREMPSLARRRVDSSGLQEIATDDDRVQFQLHPGAALAATVIDLDLDRRNERWAAAALLAAGLFLGLLAQEISYYAHGSNDSSA